MVSLSESQGVPEGKRAEEKRGKIKRRVSARETERMKGGE